MSKERFEVSAIPTPTHTIEQGGAVTPYYVERILTLPDGGSAVILSEESTIVPSETGEGEIVVYTDLDSDIKAFQVGEIITLNVRRITSNIKH